MSTIDNSKSPLETGGGSPKTVILRNGTEEAEPLVKVVSMVVNNLLDEGFGGMLTLYEAIEVARNPNHKIFGDYGKTLQKFSIIDQNGNMHQSIRNILLSSAEGDGLNMKFVSPVVKGN